MLIAIYVGSVLLNPTGFDGVSNHENTADKWCCCGPEACSAGNFCCCQKPESESKPTISQLEQCPCGGFDDVWLAAAHDHRWLETGPSVRSLEHAEPLTLVADSLASPPTAQPPVPPPRIM